MGEASQILETMALGPQWPTVDPFLFCAHHVDHYPRGNGNLGPSAALAGRSIGQDFAGIDGWNMYHGQVVPGFPQHPHRGFETVSYMRTGLMDHADSLGAQARFGEGDVQWMTAGSGIVHSEMFPLLSSDQPNPLEMFQIWVNLPAADKMVDPYFSMLWNHDIPKLADTDTEGRSSNLTVIAGSVSGAVAPAPPPHSWASNPQSDLAIWHLRLDPGAQRTLPAAAHPETVRTLYLCSGGPVSIGSERVPSGTGAVVRSESPVELRDAGEGSEIMVLQGRPIGEPVARYGPFVMNHRSEIEQAMTDYQRTRFGGWPWPADDPNHGPKPRRFARHADGRLEEFEMMARGA